MKERALFIFIAKPISFFERVFYDSIISADDKDLLFVTKSISFSKLFHIDGWWSRFILRCLTQSADYLCFVLFCDMSGRFRWTGCLWRLRCYLWSWYCWFRTNIIRGLHSFNSSSCCSCDTQLLLFLLLKFLCFCCFPVGNLSNILLCSLKKPGVSVFYLRQWICEFFLNWMSSTITITITTTPDKQIGCLLAFKLFDGIGFVVWTNHWCYCWFH